MRLSRYLQITTHQPWRSKFLHRLDLTDKHYDVRPDVSRDFIRAIRARQSNIEFDNIDEPCGLTRLLLSMTPNLQHLGIGLTRGPQESGITALAMSNRFLPMDSTIRTHHLQRLKSLTISFEIIRDEVYDQYTTSQMLNIFLSFSKLPRLKKFRWTSYRLPESFTSSSHAELEVFDPSSTLDDVSSSSLPTFDTPCFHSLTDLYIHDYVEDIPALGQILKTCTALETLDLSTRVEYDRGKNGTSILRTIATSGIGRTLLCLHISITALGYKRRNDTSDYWHISESEKPLVMPDRVLQSLVHLQKIRLPSFMLHTSTRTKRTKRLSQILPRSLQRITITHCQFNLDYKKLLADLLSQFPDLKRTVLQWASKGMSFKDSKHHAPSPEISSWRRAHPILENILLGIGLSGVDFCPQMGFRHRVSNRLVPHAFKHDHVVKIAYWSECFYFRLAGGCDRNLQGIVPERHTKIHQRYEELMALHGYSKQCSDDCLDHP